MTRAGQEIVKTHGIPFVRIREFRPVAVDANIRPQHRGRHTFDDVGR